MTILVYETDESCRKGERKFSKYLKLESVGETCNLAKGSDL